MFRPVNFIAFITAIAFLWIGRKFSAKWIHVVSLLLGAIGLLSVMLPPSMLLREIVTFQIPGIRVFGQPIGVTWNTLECAFVGVGIAWASILSMPYAMLSSALPPERMGVYMGIFNFFIVIPQIVIALILSRVMENFPQVNRLTAVVFGGVCMLIACVFTLFVPSATPSPRRLQRVVEGEGMLPTATPPESPLATD